MSDHLTADEMIGLWAQLREHGCVCMEVEVAIDRETRHLEIAHDAWCPCVGVDATVALPWSAR